MNGRNKKEDYDQENDIKEHLFHQLNLFRRAWLTDNGWRKLVHDEDIDNHYNSMSIFDLRNKAKYLTKAIENAIETYEEEGWTNCCNKAIQDINKFENSHLLQANQSDNYNHRWMINCPSTLRRWYRVFNHHNNQHFINPFSLIKKKKLPALLDSNPDITEAIISFCNNNLLELSTHTLQEFIIGTCLPQLLQKRRKELNNPDIDMEFIKKENNLKTVCSQTVGTWMNLLGYRYCETKKSYYCDSHERPENIAYRYKYIDRYLEREFRCFRWIQVTEEKYNEMINDGSIFTGEPYHFVNDLGQKSLEFHVDDCEDFSDWDCWPDTDSEKFGGCLSVRMPEGVKPIIVFGQDECIFKQYIFTKKSWMGPEGQTAIIPKDEGQGLMMSSFVSRDYGFNLQISSSQMALVNQRRCGQHCKDTDAAVLKCGNSN